MSMTQSVGVVGANHWSYMAKKLAKCIDQIIAQGRVEKSSISQNLYLDAKDFFQLLSQAVRSEIPDNPPASSTVYMIATRTIQSTLGDQRPGARTVDSLLSQYLLFFDKIRDSRKLSPQEIKTAKSLKDFLFQLYLDGRSEAYEARVGFDEESSF